MRRKPLSLLIILSTILLLAACQPPAGETPPAEGHSGDEVDHAADATPLPGWTIYHNEKYDFLLDVPPGWRVMETPNQDYPTQSEQIWLSAEPFSPFAEKILPDVLVSIFQESPAAHWEPQYFDDYSVELLIGELPVEGTYITGLHKVTGRRAEVVIAHLPGGAFLELQRTGGEELSEVFNRVVLTLRPVE